MVIFGTLAQAANKINYQVLSHRPKKENYAPTAVTSLAPFLAIPSFSYFFPIMKPVMFCKNNNGTLRWQHSSMKWAACNSTMVTP
jgi:hypothetical protein